MREGFAHTHVWVRFGGPPGYGAKELWAFLASNVTSQEEGQVTKGISQLNLDQRGKPPGHGILDESGLEGKSQNPNRRHVLNELVAHSRPGML